MKIRCVTNSIRLRCRKSDLEELKTAGEINESLDFGGVVFYYKLKINSSAINLESSYNNNILLVEIPDEMAKHWMDSNQVGLEFQNNKIHILIEKDFPCLDRPEEDKSDTFTELAQKENHNC